MIIAIGSDHAGFMLKSDVIAWLQKIGHQVLDLGCNDDHTSVDYPIFGEKVAMDVVSGKVDLGILICGTGIGMSITANKIAGIRAALCGDTFSARASRAHNNANVLVLGSRVTGPGLALDIVEAFLNSSFEGGRHQRRLDLVQKLEINTGCSNSNY